MEDGIIMMVLRFRHVQDEKKKCTLTVVYTPKLRTGADGCLGALSVRKNTFTIDYSI